MALDTELMAMGIPAAAARALGGNVAGNPTGLVLTGNNSQANGLQLSADYNLIGTSGGTTNSCVLPSSVGASECIIGVASAQTTVNIFPALGEKIVDQGAIGAANAAVTLAASKMAYFQPANGLWFMIRGA